MAFTIDLFPSAVTNAASLSFDIMVDPSSAADAYGGYGYFQVATRDGNYRTNQIGAFSLELGNPYYDVPIPGQWWHVSITGLSGVNTKIQALTFEDFNGSDRNINGQVIIYVDNVTLYKAGTPVPPDISIAQVTATGLYLTSTTNSTVDAPQSEHEGIRATNTAFGWVGGGANKISYSATIASYPGAQYTNYGSYIFLVHGAATEPNPDWTEANVVWLDIEGQADGSATGALRYKVNDAGTNDQYAGSGYLGTVTNINGPLGTWSVTFTNNDYVGVRAPGGKTLAAHLALGSGLSSFA